MHFISGTNFYIFRHQGSILKEFIKNKGSTVVLTFIIRIKGPINFNF